MNYRFDTVGAFVDHVENTPVAEENKLKELESTATDASHAKWCGSQNWDEAIARVRDGWPDGERYLSQIDSEIVLDATREIEERTVDVCGAYPEVGMAVAGDPECMISVSANPTPHANVYINVGASCRATEEQLRAHVASVLSGVLSAKNAVSLDIWAYSKAQTHQGKTHLDIVRVLGSDEHTDLARLVGVFCNVSFFRRLCFRSREIDPQFHHACGYGAGYGFTAPLETADLDAVGLPHGVIVKGLEESVDVQQALADAGITVH